MEQSFLRLRRALGEVSSTIYDSYVGTVTASRGNTVYCAGLAGRLGLGDLCRIHNAAVPAQRSIGIPEDLEGGAGTYAEVIGFEADEALLLPYGDLHGVTFGDEVRLEDDRRLVFPDRTWCGRVIDAMAQSIDTLGALPKGPIGYSVHAAPLEAHRRRLLGPRIGLGVRALDLFTPCRRGQRLGVFAGSGVGKSTLLSMMAQHADADVIVVGLIGERGRELNEFVQSILGPKGLPRSVVIAATSDTSPLLRRRAGYLTLTVAEYFRDQGANVLCLFDNVTRFAMALREIRSAAGEPPALRGYPAGALTELPRLLERAGPGEAEGSITALFSILVEGDDHTEPVADTVRGILDGHVWLDRNIAERGRFPAIDVLKSVSRTAPDVYDDTERGLVMQARAFMHEYAKMEEIIELGAYQPGSNPTLDQAIRLKPEFDALLAQHPLERATLEESRQRLNLVLADSASTRTKETTNDS